VGPTSNLGRFQYKGMAYIPEVGLYHARARTYSQYLGRFMQTDPIGYAGGPNLYSFVQNSPVDLSDPTGLTSCDGKDGTSYRSEPGDLNPVQVEAINQYQCKDWPKDSPDELGTNQTHKDGGSGGGRQPQGKQINTSKEVKDFICGMLAKNGYNCDQAEIAAYRYRNDPQHPEQEFEPVARSGENWLTAASYDTYYPGGSLNGYKASIYSWQYLKLVPFIADPRDGFSREALNAGLDGHEHRFDTPEQLKELCGG